ncbi:hypothetical protein MASR1M48_17360 [Lactococcus petauri]
MKTIRFFYRNRAGKDTKLLGWTSVLMANPTFRGQLMSHPSNEFVSYADIDVSDLSHQETDANGAFKKKVVGGTLVDRDQADLDRDIARRVPLIQKAEDDILPLLQGKEKVTWQMIGAYHLLKYVKSLQAALLINDAILSAEGQASKAALASIEANLVIPCFGIMSARDAALAQLDTED